jgi:hypothetical protein
MPAGRPTEYSTEIAQEICDFVADTPMMLEDLCDQHPHWPCAQTVYKWRRRHPEFEEIYAIAKRCQIEVLVSHAFRIARDRTSDFVEDNKGNLHANTPRIQGIRSEVDTIKWLAGKLAPKLYGDKITKEVGPESQTLLQGVIDKL